MDLESNLEKISVWGSCYSMTFSTVGITVPVTPAGVKPRSVFCLAEGGQSAFASLLCFSALC